LFNGVVNAGSDSSMCLVEVLQWKAAPALLRGGCSAGGGGVRGGTPQQQQQQQLVASLLSPQEVETLQGLLNVDLLQALGK
jgi:hypothetical protein